MFQLQRLFLLGSALSLPLCLPSDSRAAAGPFGYPPEGFGRNLLQPQQLAILEVLVGQMSRKSDAVIKESLFDQNPQIRFAAAWKAGDKKLFFIEELIGLLTDTDLFVRQAARRSLIVLGQHALAIKKVEILQRETGQPPSGRIITRHVDFGPLPHANPTYQMKAAQRWNDWWAKQDIDRPPPKPATPPTKKSETE